MPTSSTRVVAVDVQVAVAVNQDRSARGGKLIEHMVAAAMPVDERDCPAVQISA
jgi:hypothetical protein